MRVLGSGRGLHHRVLAAGRVESPATETDSRSRPILHREQASGATSGIFRAAARIWPVVEGITRQEISRAQSPVRGPGRSTTFSPKICPMDGWTTGLSLAKDADSPRAGDTCGGQSEERGGPADFGKRSSFLAKALACRRTEELHRDRGAVVGTACGLLSNICFLQKTRGAGTESNFYASAISGWCGRAAARSVRFEHRVDSVHAREEIWSGCESGGE